MSVPEVYAAIAAVSSDLARCGVPKAGRNEAEQYQFRGIDQIYNRLSPALQNTGCAYCQRSLSAWLRNEPTALAIC